MLAYRNYKVVVERCLLAENWGVTLGMNILEDMNKLEVVYPSHVVSQHHRFYWILL